MTYTYIYIYIFGTDSKKRKIPLRPSQVTLKFSRGLCSAEKIMGK